MAITTIVLAGQDGAGSPITLRAEQRDSDNSVAIHTAVEVAGLPVSAANAMPVQAAASALINSAAGVVGTSAAILVPFSSTRKWLMISNRSQGTETHDLGSANVTVGGGIPVAAGGGFLFSGAGAAGPVYGITTVPGSAFSYVEG